MGSWEASESGRRKEQSRALPRRTLRSPEAQPREQGAEQPGSISQRDRERERQGSWPVVAPTQGRRPSSMQNSCLPGWGGAALGGLCPRTPKHSKEGACVSSTKDNNSRLDLYKCFPANWPR